MLVLLSATQTPLRLYLVLGLSGVLLLGFALVRGGGSLILFSILSAFEFVAAVNILWRLKARQ